MKKLIVLLGIGVSSYAANGSINPRAEASRTLNQQQIHQGQAEMQQNTAPSDCSHLSQEEQQFASQLNNVHRTMFCHHFSAAQRVEAMTLVSSDIQMLTGQKTTITPDQAVEMIVKNALEAQSNTNGSQQGQPQQEQQPQQGQQQQNPYGNYSSPNGSSNSSSSNPYSNY